MIEFRSGEYAHYSRLTNCSIVDYNPAFRSTEYKWVSIYGTHNRVDHCYFEGKNHSGTTLVVWFERTTTPPAHFHLIDNNYFGYRPPLGENGGETIRIGTSTYSMNNSNSIVESNYFEHCNGEIEIISNKSCENIYRANTFFECEGALTLRHGNRCLVEGNFFFGNKKDLTGGVRVIGEDHIVINNYFESLYGSSFKSALPIVNGVPNSPLNRYFQVKNAVIAFNTFVDCRYSMIIGAGSDNERTLPPENCTIANNVVFTPFQIIRLEDEPINLKWEGNIMQGSSLGIPQPEGITLTDPFLYLAEDGLWRPDSGLSPVLGAAQGDYSFVAEDMDGQMRGSIKDVGADQVSAEPITRRPLTAKDVGPDWMQSAVPVLLTVRTKGSGQVMFNPTGPLYEPNTQIELVAVPDSGWRFAGWDGDIISSEDTLQFVISEDLVLRAVFEQDVPLTFKLSVYVFSSGGTVILDPPGESYPESTLVTLTAVPKQGWKFVRWEGDLISTENPDTVLMDDDKMILGVFEESTSVAINNDISLKYHLAQNYPNPFNTSTSIQFILARNEHVQITIYNVFSDVVETLVNEKMNAGSYTLTWEASKLSSGVYFYNMKAGKTSITTKMLLFK